MKIDKPHHAFLRLFHFRPCRLQLFHLVFQCSLPHVLWLLVTSDSMVQPQMDQHRSRTSVIWTWSNRTESGTLYTCIRLLLTFWCWKCRVHGLTIQQRKIFTRCCHQLLLLWLMLSVITWNEQKQQSKCYTWTKSDPKNVPRPNRSDVGPGRFQYQNQDLY